MKKIMNWMFAATLICGTIVFTSCKDTVRQLIQFVRTFIMQFDAN